MRIRRGDQTTPARGTEFSILGEEIARRTFDESGNYTVRPFQFDIKECIDNDFKGKTNKGVFQGKTKTDGNQTPDESLLTVRVSAGKAFVKGFEIEKLVTTDLDMQKAREFDTVNASIATFELGNFATITNLFGS